MLFIKVARTHCSRNEDKLLDLLGGGYRTSRSEEYRGAFISKVVYALPFH